MKELLRNVFNTAFNWLSFILYNMFMPMNSKKNSANVFSPETLFRPLKGPETMKYPTKDEVRVRVKQKILCQGVISTSKLFPKEFFDTRRSL